MDTVLNVLVALGTVALAVIGAIASKIAIRTLRAIEAQTRVIQESVSVARTSAHAAEDSAAAALKNAEAFVSSERAWVVPELVPLAVRYGKWWYRVEPYGRVSMSEEEIVGGHHLRHKLRLKNIGKTPAHILSFEVRHSVLPAGEVHSEIGKTDFWIVPNQEETLVPIIDIAQYTKDLVREVGDAKKLVLLNIEGCVRYKHIFSQGDAIESAQFAYLYSSAAETLNKFHRSRNEDQTRSSPTPD